jgi:uncharacterized protein DUF4058
MDFSGMMNTKPSGSREKQTMPLRDHFHLPMRGLCTWESFHSGWTNEIMRGLNRCLPNGYVARPNVKLGVDVEADVGTLEQLGRQPGESNGGVMTAVWSPPRPTLSVPVDFQRLDVFEIQVLREGGLEMVAAIELVSPRNKDRPSARRNFAAKLAAYLQAGVAVVVVDVVTSRTENLYDLLCQHLGLAEENGYGSLYAFACRTVPPDEPGLLEAWVESLNLGQALPTLPLWLEADLAVPLDLEQSYQSTFVQLRVPSEM